MRTRLKICCISSIEEAALAVAHGADALGLVSAMPSGPGVIEDALIAEIARTVPPPVSTFLLTSRTDGDEIARHVLASGVSTVQIVDRVECSAYRVVRAAAPSVKIVQVLHVWDEDALAHARECAEHVDALLLDSGSPKPPAGQPKTLGGTGKVHNWEISARIVQDSPRPVFLAGGLSAANAADAIAKVRPYGLDVCSGVRTAGRLDPAKLRAMAEVVFRRAG